VGGVLDGALKLVLNAAVPAVELRADAGALLVNGSRCSSSAGQELGLAELTALEISGGSEDNAVILDLGSGDWSGLFAAAESVQLALGAGKNGLLVRGTAEADVYHHAMRGTDVALDLVGFGHVNLIGSKLTQIGFNLGSGDDRLENLAPFASPAEALSSMPLSVPLVVLGGAGNDWLVGGTADDQFDAGEGDDVVSGLAGSDLFLSGLEGDGADIYNGGLGYDELSYELRTVDLELNVCLSAALIGCSEGACDCSRSGAAGEGDRIVNLEGVTGGDGNDILRGTDSSDSLHGGPGNDSLYGFGGSDLLAGERGIDLLEGGLDGDICDGQANESVSHCEL
jgi:Ca2+-binding RTX toxin-like protein